MSQNREYLCSAFDWVPRTLQAVHGREAACLYARPLLEQGDLISAIDVTVQTRDPYTQTFTFGDSISYRVFKRTTAHFGIYPTLPEEFRMYICSGEVSDGTTDRRTIEALTSENAAVKYAQAIDTEGRFPDSSSFLVCVYYENTLAWHRVDKSVELEIYALRASSL